MSSMHICRAQPFNAAEGLSPQAGISSGGPRTGGVGRPASITGHAASALMTRETFCYFIICFEYDLGSRTGDQQGLRDVTSHKLPHMQIYRQPLKKKFKKNG